jgi:hypothetical protein
MKAGSDHHRQKRVEGIADLMFECVKDDDRFYLAYETSSSRSQKHLNDRSICIREEGPLLSDIFKPKISGR